MKYICAILLVVPLVSNAKCSIQTVEIDGKVMTCYVCPNYTTCN